MMDRRAFIRTLLGSLVAMPPAARGQSTKPVRIGFLSGGISSFTKPQARLAHLFQALRDGLAEFGYVENRNLTIEYRYAEEHAERVPVLAAELVKRAVDVIIATGPSVITAARRATETLPIVGLDYESDPIAAGFATSFARPSGNITGVFLDQASLSGKWLQLLKETVPLLGSRCGVLGPIYT